MELENAPDDFELAFDAALAEDTPPTGETGKEPPKEETPAADPAAEKPAEPDGAEEPAKDASPAKEETPKADPDATAKAAEVAAKKAEKAEKDRKAAEDKKAADDAEQARLEAEKQKAVESAAKEVLSTEEQEAYQQALDVYPELGKVFEAYNRVMQAKLDNVKAAYEQKLTDMLSQVDTRVAPALDTAQSLAQAEFNKAVTAAHADAFTLLPEIETWIEAQPEFLRAGYNSVLDRGTAAQTIELFNIFKNATGKVSQGDTAAAEADAAKKAAEAAKKKEKEEKLKAQEGIRGRDAGGQTGAVDPNDFEGAFEKFAASA